MKARAAVLGALVASLPLTYVTVEEGTAFAQRRGGGGTGEHEEIQMAVGETQWRNHLPWWLVLIHVVLATGVWTGIVAIAALVRGPESGRRAALP